MYLLIFLTLSLWGGTPENIVLITVDTLRADHLSAYGYHRETSPNLDRLLRQSALFEQARTVEPLTAPSLASMLTSIYPHQHGATRNGMPIYSGLPSLTKEFQKQGYQTAAFVGNWTLRDGISGLGEHFQTYREVFTRKRWLGLFLSESTAEDLSDAALKWLEQPTRPFFLWVHYADPHAPYRYHQAFAAQLGVDQEDKANQKERTSSHGQVIAQCKAAIVAEKTGKQVQN